MHKLASPRFAVLILSCAGLAMAVGCSNSDTSPDDADAADMGMDDASDDVAPDTSTDTSTDTTPSDASTDTADDVEIDTETDVALDTAGDTPSDGSDADGDVGPQLGVAGFARYFELPSTDIIGSLLLANDSEQCAAEDVSCLQTVCEFELCLYVVEFRYESTPQTGTDGPALQIQGRFAQTAERGEYVGASPVMIYNHGGTDLGNNDNAFMLNAAARGYAVVASHYRGGAGTATDGEVEGCLGEIDDAFVLAAIAADVAPDVPRAMIGGSHGGCVTVGAALAGADVDAAVALWPGTDGARRYVYNSTLGAPGSAMEIAAGDCPRAATELGFIRGALLGVTNETLGGPLPDPTTTDYTCDDPSLHGTNSVWDGLDAEQAILCDRSPLFTASTLDDNWDAPLLIVHGERDPFIDARESCFFVRDAGGFDTYRVDDAGIWNGTVAEGTCSSVLDAFTGGEPPSDWSGDRHLVLVQPLGHGDSDRASLTDACDERAVASIDVNAMAFGFLAEKLSL